MNAIELKSLHKSFGHNKALSGVTLTVPKGEMFGFLGPNGAGKTTTIRCMMDFIRPTSGSVKILGHDARVDSVYLKTKVGYLSAAPYLYDKWTGEQHLRFVAQLRKQPVDLSLAQSLGLSTKQKVKHLSTGNQQKLAIALAFAGNPELLILDEPTKGLDPLLQNQLYATLRDYRKQGGTVFMSSHNLGEVEKVCTSIAVIKDGEVFVEETLAKLRQKNIHTITATFSKAVPADSFAGARVQVVHAENNTVSLRVQGDINETMRKITAHTVKDLEVAHASLEELFMEVSHE